MQKYSLSIGLKKGAVSTLAILGALVAFAGFSDLTIWGLLETYLRPVLGSLTVGGLITVWMNYLKFKKKEGE